MEIQKPFDAINLGKDKRVVVELKNGRKYVGILKAFDVHINCVLENVEEYEGEELKRKMNLIFIRGDTITNIVIQ